MIAMGAAGAGFSDKVVLALGTASIISNGVGMGLGVVLVTRT